MDDDTFPGAFRFDGLSGDDIQMRRFFDETIRLPMTAMASGMEMLLQTMQEMQRVAWQGVDGMMSRMAHTLNGGWKDGSRAHPGTDDRADNNARERREDTEMRDKSLSGNDLKLVRYKVLFVKRDYEVAFPEQEQLISDDLSGSEFTAWKIAEFMDKLKETQAPRKWRDKRYPRNYGDDRQAVIERLPENDKKYLRVYYEVLARYEREKFHHRERQIEVLEEIRDNLKKRPDGNGKPHTAAIVLPRTLRLAGALNPYESEFGDEFFHFPDFLGQRPAPGGTKLSGWIELQFSKPSGNRADFIISFYAVGTDDMIQWGNGAEYRFFRDRAFQNPMPFNNPGIKSRGTLNLQTGEVEKVEMHALFQNSVIAIVDKLNRIPFGFPNDYPPPPLPPGVELPFPDRPPIFSKARFSTDSDGQITGFEFHGLTIAPVTLFPFIPGLFPPFSFGPNGSFYFANPTNCPAGTPPEACPTDETNPDGLLLSMPAFFHPHLDLVTEEMREAPVSSPVPPCVQGGAVAGAVLVACEGRLYHVGGFDGEKATKRVEIYNPKTNKWQHGTALPTAVRSAQGAAIGSKIYIASGRTGAGAATGLLQVFDTATEKWSHRASVPTPVAQAVAAAVDEKFYLIGGDTGGAEEGATPTDKVQIYDPATDSWSVGTASPLATAGSSGVVVDSRIYVIGGRAKGDHVIRTVSIYNTMTDKWKDANDPEHTIYRAAAGYINDHIYLVGGRHSVHGPTLRTMQIYDVVHNAWCEGVDEPVPTAESAGAVLDGKLYLAGGRIMTRGDEAPGDVTDACQVFNPIQGWTVCDSRPLFTSAGVLNGAALSVGPHALSPGSHACIVGYNFTTAPATAPPNASLPLKLGGISIMVDDQPAPIISVSPARVDFQVPYGVEVHKTGQRKVPLRLTRDGAHEQAPAIDIHVQAASPGIYIYTFGETQEPNFLNDATSLACNHDGTLNYPSQPAIPDEVVTLYTTGLGQVTPQPANGARAEDNPQNKLAHKLTVTIGGIKAEVVSAGLSAHKAGVYEIRVRVPHDSPQANNVHVEVTVNGVKSNRAMISVQATSQRPKEPAPCEVGKQFILNQ